MRTHVLLSRPRALAGCSSSRPAPPIRAAAAQRSMRLHVASVNQHISQQPIDDGAGGVQRGWSKTLSQIEIDMPVKGFKFQKGSALYNDTAADPHDADIWQHMRQLQEEKTIVTVKVAATHRRGLLVSYEPFEGLGLLPAGQLLPGLQAAPADSLVGTELPAVITAVDEDKHDVIFSNKLASTQAALQNLKVGDVMTGVVQGVKPYGAFVELHDGIVGLLHISEISHTRVTSVEAVLKEGEELQVVVVEVDLPQGRVALSVKQVEQYLSRQELQELTCPAEVWQQMRQLKEEDSTVTVKVEGTHKRGYLVRYEPCGGLGLLPAIQLEPELRKELRTSSAGSLIGRELPVKFKEVNEEKKYVVFSNRLVQERLQKERVRAAMQEVKVGDVVTGVVQSLRPYGAFLDLGNGVLGLLHVSEISHDRVTSVEAVLKEGDELQVVVIQVDLPRSRVTLSVKQLGQELYHQELQELTCPAEVWQQMRQLKEEDAIVTVKVEGTHNKVFLVRYEPCGGLGLLPASQLEPELRKELRASSAGSLIGRELPVKFKEVNEGRKLVVFSNKRVHEGLRKERLRAAMQELKESHGITCPAEVWQQMRQLQVEDATVIVKVEGTHTRGYLVRYEPCGGLGLLPAIQLERELRTESNPSPASVLIGRELPVKFKEVNEEEKLVVFSNKLVQEGLRKERLRAAMQSLKVGDVVTGVVQGLRQYGAYVHLHNGAVGLLHVSQISHGHVASAHTVLKEGDELKVLILKINQDRGGIILSTKKLEPTPGDMLRDPQLVFDKAEEMGDAFRKRWEASRAAKQTVLAVMDPEHVLEGQTLLKGAGS